MMTRKKIKETFYNLTRHYKSEVVDGKKVSSYIVRDCLTEVFSVRCPDKIVRDVDAFVITYINKTYKLVYRVRKNVSDNTCYVTQFNYDGSYALEDKYIVHFPADTKLFKKKVKNDTDKLHERK